MESVIKANRPELKESSIKNYVSNLRSLYRNVFDDDKYTLDRFNDTISILPHVHQRPLSSQMALLSYLVVLTGNPSYQLEMKRVKAMRDQQVEAREPPDEDHTTSPIEIKEIFKALKKRSAEIYHDGQYTKETLLETVVVPARLPSLKTVNSKNSLPSPKTIALTGAPSSDL